MKLLIAVIISITLFGTFVSSADEKTETEPPKVGDTAPDFVLQDVEEKEHNLKKLRGKVVFLIMGNRKIRKEDDKWAEAFQKDYRESSQVIAFIIADMRSVPGFIPKGFIRSQLKKNPPPVKFLLDWKGEVHKRYHTEKKKPTLYLISQKGTIVFHRKADFKPEVYAELKKEIEKLLATPDAE
jgi:peroxiredoxin